MIDYAELDAAILELVDEGGETFHSLCVSLDSKAQSHSTPKREPWRAIDCRLQALRKRGLITYSRALHKWQATKEPT